MIHKILFFISSILSLSVAVAQEDTLFRDEDSIKSGLTESQWITFVGMEGMRLQSKSSFILQSKNTHIKNENLVGPSIGVARKWYLLGNFNTSFEPMVYYIFNSDEEIRTPSDESISTYHVSEYADTIQYYGTRLSQSIGYTFEFSKFNIEPFFQFYVGYGMGRAKAHYHWDTHLSTEHEEYDLTVRENITHQGVAAGLQVIALNGYMSYFKISKSTLTYRKRKSNMYLDADGVISQSQTSETLNDNLDKYSVTVGLGYIF